MKDVAMPVDPRQHAAVRNYILISLVSLVILLMALLQRNFGFLSIFPILVGSLALAARWRMAPLMLLLVLAGGLFVQGRMRPSFQFFNASQALSDVILIGSVLVYVIANYRLQGLMLNLFPADARLPLPRKVRKKRQKSAVLPPLPETLLQRRSPNTVTPRELGGMLASVVLIELIGAFCWFGLQVWQGDPLRGESRGVAWSLILLAWIVGMAILLPATVFALVRWRRLTKQEAVMILQDAVWLETRKEQASINRWIVWARQKSRRKKGNS